MGGCQRPRSEGGNQSAVDTSVRGRTLAAQAGARAQQGLGAQLFPNGRETVWPVWLLGAGCAIKTAVLPELIHSCDPIPVKIPSGLFHFSRDFFFSSVLHPAAHCNHLWGAPIPATGALGQTGLTPGPTPASARGSSEFRWSREPAGSQLGAPHARGRGWLPSEIHMLFHAQEFPYW